MPPPQHLLIALFAALTALTAHGQSCEARYNSATQTLDLPCIHIDDQSDRYSASLKQGGSWEFALTESQQRTLSDAIVQDIQIVTTPFPVATVFFGVSGCTQEYQPAGQLTYEYEQRTFIITIKTYYAAKPNSVCPAMAWNRAIAFT